jgi:hypothetical protein
MGLMTPERSTELLLKLAGPLSGWWLVVLFPAVLALGWWIYQRQFKGVPRGSALALTGIRLTLLSLVLLLVFRPSILLRTTLTYRGRVLVVIDDSESMTVADSSLADADALRLSRMLTPPAETAHTAFARMAAALDDVAARLRAFQRYSRDADRGTDAFWDRAASAQEDVNGLLVRFSEAAVAVPQLDVEASERLQLIRDGVSQEQQGFAVFFTGSDDPGGAAYDGAVTRLEQHAAALQSLQGAADAVAIAGGDQELIAAARAVRERNRLSLAGAALAALRPALQETLTDQALQLVSGMTGEQQDLARFTQSSVGAHRGTTDLVARLNALLTTPDDAPLTAILLISDGRDLAGRPAAAMHQEAVRRGVPVFTAGIGPATEPTDLAVLKVVAPPFAVAGSPVRVRVLVKTAIADAVDGRLVVWHGAEEVAAETVALVPGEQLLEIRFAPEQTGLFRYSVSLDSLEGEVFPRRNNAAEFVVHVRETRAKVLFLDWKPRWEARFALNVLKRLDYLDLNAIIVLVQEEAALRRGVEKGTWPDSPEALAMYDLIIVGDVPVDLLTADEWTALQVAVRDQGKTLCFLGANGAAPAAVPAPLRAALLPFPGAAQAAASVPSLADLQLSPAGALQPTTRRLAPGVQTAALTQPGLPADSQVLAVAGSNPLIAGRFVGAGKTYLIGSDDLWRLLNPTTLGGHEEIYLRLLNWAIEGGPGGAGAETPELAVDQRSFLWGEPVQVWARRAPAGAVVQAIAADGAAAGEAALVLAHPGARLQRAVFAELPPANVTFRLRDSAAAAGPVSIVRDYPELKHLARNDTFLATLSAATGGRHRELPDLRRSFAEIEPKIRIEKHESVWRLWSSALILALAAILLTTEWVWRKFVGLV